MTRGILVHEWLATRGGSENVFEALSDVFPDAERFCLWNDSRGRFTGVEETWLARTPIRRSKALAVPFAPLAWRTLPARDADWVLCSSHLFAHHAKFGGSAGDAPKLVYVHTPARYLWVPELDGRGSGWAARTLSRVMKPLDRRRAQEPVAIAANSRYVAERIADTWQREATVIHPPVDTHAFRTEAVLTAHDEARVATLPGEFLLGVSRFVPYKQLDRVIEAGRVSGMPVVLAGSGADEARLRAYAEARHPGRVTFVVEPSFGMLNALYHRASAVVFAPIEDFGIIPVEAMAAGTPVVANAIGGAAESVIDGVTGALTTAWEGDELAAAVDRALRSDAEACRVRAEEFSTERFADEIRGWVARSVGNGSVGTGTAGDGSLGNGMMA